MRGGIPDFSFFNHSSSPTPFLWQRSRRLVDRASITLTHTLTQLKISDPLLECECGWHPWLSEIKGNGGKCPRCGRTLYDGDP
ncbi:hypothetical protein KKF32_04150 [Patescibacteria group bacterium]|nr:hypothetical protein [Patescibacteria group bacterium]